jgi:hypothetical protein
VSLYPKQPVQPSTLRRTPLWRTRTVAAALLFSCGLAFAQHPGTPAVEQPRQTGGGGGGVGIGINIDLGSLFNAIKNATKKDEQTKPPVLQKKAVSVSSGNSGNYTVDWVVQYANNTSLPQTSVTVVDGPIATIIPTSVQPYPPVWAGATNANPPANNYAQWFGAVVPPHGFMTATMASSGPSSMNLTGSGDGYQPIPYTRLAVPAGRRIYIMNHHALPSALHFKCLDVATGTDCANWVGGKPLPMGNNSGNVSATLTNSSEYVISNGKFYYTAIGSLASGAGFGIGCYDLENDTQCGYAKMDNRATGLYANGPWQIGNELYVASYDGFMYCAKLAPGLPACQTSGYQIAGSTIKLNVERGTVEDLNISRLAGKVVGTKLYLTSLKGSTKYTNCYDTITKNTCWATAAPTKGTASYSHGQMRGNYTNYLYYNTALVPVAICSQINDPAGQFCVSLATGNQHFGVPMAWASANPVVGLEAYSQGKSYFIQFNDNPSTGVFCWDWASTSNCTTNPNGAVATPPKPNTKHYGLAADDQGCVWAYGHEGVLWNFDPSNIDSVSKLAKPCGSSAGKAQQIFQPLTYCSGPKPFHWTGVEIKSASLANYDKMIVRVLDNTNNAVLLSKDLKTANTLLADVTSVDAQTLSKPLKIEVEYTPKAGTSDKPYIEVRYNAPPPEFCFQSTHTCKQDKITNIVETPDPANPSKIISVKVDVNKPQVCPIIEPPPPPPPPYCLPGTPGWPLCLTCANPPCIGTPPPPPDTKCLLGDCAPKPPVSIGEEYKEPKVSCVRKAQPVAEEPKKVAPKPRPKPAVVTAPVTADPNAPPPPPKSKSKPRPKPVQAKPAAEDDCE